MVRKLLLERPILVGGLGLAASFGLLGGLHDVLADGTTLASLIAAGTGMWWWRRQATPADVPDLKPAAPHDRAQVEAAIAALKPTLATLQQEFEALETNSLDVTVQALEVRRQALLTELDRTTLTVAIVGQARTGKSALQRVLHDTTEALTASLTLTEVQLTDLVAQPTLLAELQHQDGVVYLVAEDLTESALKDLTTLVGINQRVIVALTKCDNYLPDDRTTILENIRARLRTLPQAVEGVAIASAPKPIKVRTYEATGQVCDRLETPVPEVAALAKQLAQWQQQETAHLVTQTVMRQVQQLRTDIYTQLNLVRRQRALPLVEQLQWAAAATAFASPVPSLDLLATIAINGQLVMDLGRVYHQPLALDHAKAIAAELAKVVVKLGLVEVSTQLLTTALKSHLATFVVGGSVQGLSAAYLTRLSGESLMAYFEERSRLGQTEATISVEAIGQKLRSLVPATQRTEFLQTLINQGMPKFSAQHQPTLAPGHTPTVKVPSEPVTPVIVQAATVSPSKSA
ncbi:MAG: DUF697 domain-containing protein [Leptolyngbyaceae cyanobacterium]